MEAVNPILLAPSPVQSEFCPACPIPHRFVKVTAGGLLHTHRANAKGDMECSECSEARPCQGTVVRGKAGFRFSGDLREKSVHRGLDYDGPYR